MYVCILHVSPPPIQMNGVPYRWMDAVHTHTPGDVHRISFSYRNRGESLIHSSKSTVMSAAGVLSALQAEMRVQR